MPHQPAIGQVWQYSGFVDFSFTSSGISFLSLITTPICLLPFFEIADVCSEKFKHLSIVTPNSFSFSVFTMLLFPMLKSDVVL